MSLSSLLKKGSLRRFATATPATVATDKSSIPSSVATVATVNVATTQKPASNDLEPAPNRVTVGRDLIPQQGNEVSIALELDPDPDRHCWPHSAAMTGTESGIFTARLAHFTGKGIPLGFAESVADKLVLRDRDKDDRRTCLECTHLSGRGAGSWQCRNWQRAVVAWRARDAQLPDELVFLLQRCDGFNGA